MNRNNLTRAEILLILVHDWTKHEDGDRAKPIVRFFIPNERVIWSETLKERIDVGGGGDAAVFRSLERKGLIKAMPLAKYAYALTEEGFLEVRKLLER